jgi:hypothetical protein
LSQRDEQDGRTAAPIGSRRQNLLASIRCRCNLMESASKQQEAAMSQLVIHAGEAT